MTCQIGPALEFAYKVEPGLTKPIFQVAAMMEEGPSPEVVTYADLPFDVEINHSINTEFSTVANPPAHGHWTLGYRTGAIKGAELYDPATGTWSATANLGTERYHHTATLLPNGKVLVAGAYYSGSAEMYDPAAATWTATAPMNHARYVHTATLLPSGKVLVAAGYSGSAPRNSAELSPYCFSIRHYQDASQGRNLVEASISRGRIYTTGDDGEYTAWL